jgi:hypothetical protein
MTVCWRRSDWCWILGFRTSIGTVAQDTALSDAHENVMKGLHFLGQHARKVVQNSQPHSSNNQQRSEEEHTMMM